VVVIIVASLVNSFSVFIHYFDSPNSEETFRYTIGTIIFFVMFMALFSVQTYVMIDGFILYFKWRQLVIPSSEALKVAQMDDSFKTGGQKRLELIRSLFQPEVHKMHIIFAYLQVAAVVRIAVYCWVRFRSQKAFTEWIPIADGYFYVIYLTEVWITVGMFAFLFD